MSSGKLLLVFSLLACTVIASSKVFGRNKLSDGIKVFGKQWTNSWSVKVREGVDKDAVERLAKKYGLTFKNKQPIGGLHNFYQLELINGKERGHPLLTSALRNDEKVLYAKQEYTRPMVPKKLFKHKHHF